MPLFRFVDGPVASPGVVLDLDNDAPLSVLADGIELSPSKPRVSSYGSPARDGDVVTQKSYPDLRLKIPLQFKRRTTAEEQSETIQKLARILDRGAWLQWQPDGKIEPVFYRTKFGDMDISDVTLDETPERYVTLNITAEHAAYGERVEGSATIVNDPSAVTNPMSFAFPTIQGDISTPLRLRIAADATPTRMCVGTLAHPSAIVAPSFFDVESAYIFPGSGWTDSTDTNAVYIGGTAAKLVATASTGDAEGLVSQVEALGIPIGNYRVFARAAVPVGWILKTGEGPTGDFSPNGRHVSADVGLAWRDLGVLPVPFPGAPNSIWPDTDAPTADVYLSALVERPDALPAGTITVDAWVLVPAGLTNSVRSSLALVALADVSIEDGWELWLDGLTPEAAVKSSTTTERYPGGSVVTTGFCSVVPGVPNILSLLGSDVAKGTEFVVSWSYYPRYLYDRPATT